MALLYLCDPKKNTTCSKELCQKECKMTTEKKYAKVLIDPLDDMKVYVTSETDLSTSILEVANESDN